MYTARRGMILFTLKPNLFTISFIFASNFHTSPHIYYAVEVGKGARRIELPKTFHIIFS
jgi:hypothetical protein